jgi:YidC/Oxa1 family membrane protein insertase
MLALANIFQPLISVFEAVLKFFHNSVGVPWGWSIVLLTVVIRALLLPLTLKQFHSMQRMQRLAPVIKEMQKKYKDDKQRQQQEMMKLYKEHQVNPFSSCLPLVAQLPVFISLFYMLRSSLRKDICLPIQTAFQQHYAELHHISLHAATSQTTPCGPHGGAGFLFVKDLTDKASGATLIVLIVLYVGTQLGSSLMMSSPTMDKTQRQIMLFLPLLFVLFVINFPAGVLVYWITTNGWTIGQQYFVKRRLGHMGPPLPAGASAGGGGPGPPSGPNGDTDSGGGLGALLRGRAKGDEKAKERETVAAGSRRTSAPPPSPRKKKKRSGRRR